jgi:hypothetical protein
LPGLTVLARALAAAALALLTPAAAGAADLTVDAASGFLIDATINGQPVRLRVDPETSGYIILNPAAAARLGLRGSWIRSRTQIGPVRLDGESAVAHVTLGGVRGSRRLVWIARPAVAGADGLIGPADMPYGHVTFVIHPPRAIETAAELPMEFTRRAGLAFALRVGRETVHIQFSLLKADSMATAAAGAVLGDTYHGGWSGAFREEEIEFGVVRPVRPLALASPVDLAGFRFSGFLVRTGDHRGGLALPPEPGADPNEIFVTGERRGGQRAMFALTLGLDRLGACSIIVWDNLRRRLTLRCAPPPA